MEFNLLEAKEVKPMAKKERKVEKAPFRWGKMMGQLGEHLNPLLVIYVIGDIIQDLGELFENLRALFKDTFLDEIAGIIAAGIMALGAYFTYRGIRWTWNVLSGSPLGLILLLALAAAIYARRRLGRGGGLLWVPLGICALATLSLLGTPPGAVAQTVTQSPLFSWPAFFRWLGRNWDWIFVFLPPSVGIGIIVMLEQKRRKSC